MNFLNSGKYVALAFVFVLVSQGVTGTNPVIFRSGKAEISFRDHLHHEFYWWPNTLLSYPVVFEEPVSENELVLLDRETGEQVPFQFGEWEKTSEGKTKAVLFLMADLPPGGAFGFILKKGKAKVFPKVKIEQRDHEITVQTDKLTVLFPASQRGETGFLPGPVSGISQNGKARMGRSVFQPGQKKLEQLNSKIISDGPLFAELEMSYRFTDGSTYKTNIRCINSYDFIELKEEMNGFPKGGQTCWEINWDNFSPTHRQAPNHPYGTPKNEPGFKRYDWEKIDQNMLNSHHGITYAGNDGKIPFEIGIYGNWPAERVVTSSVFWDEKSMQSVGAFMQDASFWDDKEYSIWHVSGKLNIRFYCQEGKFRWNYPVFDGKRSSAISCYPHQNDIGYMDELEQLSSPKKPHPRTKISQLSYNTFIQNRHSTIDLNRVKDWDLSYPKPLKLSPVVFNDERQSVADLERMFLNGGYCCELPISGPCQNSGYSPVPTRSFYENYVSAFNRLLPGASDQQRERLSAMFLFHAYMAAGEEYMPMRAMLSGHPNFLADVKGIPALAAFLFPEHSEAKNWGDLYEKYVDLNTRYHTRPDVESWDTRGGRWTENLGTYTWAFLRPTVRANFLLQEHGDGKNRLANEQTDRIGSFVLSSLSAPFEGESLEFYRDGNGRLDNHSWGVITPEKGPARVHPPQGAHALRRRPPSIFWRLGMALENYDPLLSENISYITRPEHDDMETLDRKKEVYRIMYPDSGVDKGTPPDFHSEKLTGYGIVLRAAVGTKDELSVHLQQIDRGPNYRWGLAADGGCGTIYFFAAGKSYSHNGKEDIGDRRIQDTDMITNFGAFKDGRFKAIGKNDLTRPMYDFSVGQFAEIVSSPEGGYSWPEYQGRSVMLVGSDYFLIYDDVYNGNMSTRFSWFTHPNEELPELNVVRGGGAGYTATKGKPEFSTHAGRETKGIWFDGTGDCLTFVSHKKGFTQEPTSYGCIVTSPDGGEDYIFRNDTPVSVNGDSVVFDGTAGLIRLREGGKQEWALFHGSRIGNGLVTIRTSDTDAGVSAVYSDDRDIDGEFACPSAATLQFEWKSAIPVNTRFYLDGGLHPVKMDRNKMSAEIPSGKHIWSLTSGLPDLPRPAIDFTRNGKGKVLVVYHPVTGAGRYRFEYSANGDSGWSTLKEQTSNSLLVKPSGTEKKGYVRMVALNKEHESRASVIYPLYFTDEKPPFPDGLKLSAGKEQVRLTWGKVLGCEEYRLFRRIKGSEKFQLIYQGKENQFTNRVLDSKAIYEYAVSAVNGNGGSLLSGTVDNDPGSWLNFDPVPGERFRRLESKWNGVDNSGEKTEMYYPD
jgi:hypothetical protein